MPVSTGYRDFLGFVGVELKAAYWRQAVANLEQAHAPVDLFSGVVA